MAYASVTELKAVIPARDLSLLSDHADGSDPDDARLAIALDDASAEIDGYIARRVELPVADPPRMLMVKCRDIAVYRLYVAIGRVTETQKDLYEKALRYLAQVAAGELAIGDDTPGDAIVTSPGVAMTEGPDRVMTRDGLKGL